METVIDFLSTYQNKSTHETYYHSIKAYLEIILECKIQKEELNSVCEQYFSHIAQEHRNSLDDDLAQFPAKAEAKHLAPKSLQLYVNVMIRFAKERGVTVSGKALRILKTTLPKNQPISQEADLDLETFQKILKKAPIRLKAEIMVLGSSGMRIGELLNITEEDIDFTSKPTTITLRPEYTKTKAGRVVFISTEATLALKDWMQERERFKGLGKIKPEENRIIPYTKTNEIASLRHHLKKCGLYKIDPVTHRSKIHFHLFRKFFLTEFKLVASTEVAEELAGHMGYLSVSYRRLSQSIMKTEYLKAEYVLTFMPSSLENIQTKGKVIGLILQDREGRIVLQYRSPINIPVT